MRAVAEAVLERLQDQVALDLGDGAADEVAGDLLGRHGCVRRGAGAARLVEPAAVGRQDAVNADLGAAGEQHRAVQRVLQLAHIARPAVGGERAAGFRRQRAHGQTVGGGIFLDEILRQLENIGRPIAQRWDLQIDHVEAEQQASRNFPSRTASVRLRLEVAMMRMSTRTGLPPPTRSMTRS